MEPRVRDLIEAEDFNALLRVIDGYCAAAGWDELLDLADLCEEAVERGKQMWPVAAHIDYRIALEAPGDYAAEVLDSPLARFSLGPLTEVAASAHTWAEMSPHLKVPHAAAYIAQERVLRGEDLSEEPGTYPEVLELPLRLEAWEPTYALATYKSSLVEVAEPWEPRAPLEKVERSEGEILDEPELTDALRDLVQPWVSESNGAARALVVEGTALSAVSALALDRVRVGSLEPAEAIQRLAWAAASGGAHGRRRGAAFGRSLAWHTAALLADLPWPAPPDDLGAALGELRWFRWDEGEPEEGWVLRVAVEDPHNGWSAAIGATDLIQSEAAS
jgi:hypothetical protein